jgi:hypothetical protein
MTHPMVSRCRIAPPGIVHLGAEADIHRAYSGLPPAAANHPQQSGENDLLVRLVFCKMMM